MKIALVVSTIHLMLLIPGAVPWGKEGHYTTCKIAEGLLTKNALDGMESLLPGYTEGDLANVCSWADEIKHDYHWLWASPLHYIDTPDFRCNYNYSRDCHDSRGSKDRCVSGAIYNYTTQLLSAFNSSNAREKDNLTEAIMFLSHFVGDIHQPLHVGFTGDVGGNTIDVSWYERKANLHEVWDELIIDSALKTYHDSDITVFIEAIRRNITDYWSNDVPEWEKCVSKRGACPDTYASESIDFACRYAYRNATPGTSLEDDYFISRLPVVEKRLAQGGVRLSSILNRIFSAYVSIESRHEHAIWKSLIQLLH